MVDGMVPVNRFPLKILFRNMDESAGNCDTVVSLLSYRA